MCSSDLTDYIHAKGLRAGIYTDAGADGCGGEKQGSGPPLFLVPGLGGDGRFWDANARELAKAFTVVVHDHRGTARSTLSKIKYTVEQMAARYEAIYRCG